LENGDSGGWVGGLLVGTKSQAYNSVLNAW
jgi:hypothetical protein